MPQLKISFKTSAIVATILIIGYFAIAYLPDIMKERKMIKEARPYLTQQLDKWKKGDKNEIESILPAFTSFNLKQWRGVTLLDYKIQSMRVINKRVYRFFGSRKYRYVPDRVAIKVILTVEDENGVQSNEEVVYHVRPDGKHHWKISAY